MRADIKTPAMVDQMSQTSENFPLELRMYWTRTAEKAKKTAMLRGWNINVRPAVWRI